MQKICQQAERQLDILMERYPALLPVRGEIEKA